MWKGARVDDKSMGGGSEERLGLCRVAIRYCSTTGKWLNIMGVRLTGVTSVSLIIT